jgi:hypothetical protein
MVTHILHDINGQIIAELPANGPTIRDAKNFWRS